MADNEIITTGTAIVGAGTWFAAKLFGPSAEALGEQLKVFLTSRAATIFQRGAELAREHNVDLAPVAPGLLARMIMDASFSEPADDITEWWANLFLDASIAGSNKHAVFSDIMALIGPVEAQCLNGFYNGFSFASRQSFFNEAATLSASIEVMFEEAAVNWLSEVPFTGETVDRLRANMISGEVPWPVRPVTWSYPFTHADGKVTRSNMSNPWYSENLMSIGILERAGVLQMLQARVAGYGFTSWVKAVAMTPLGLEFYQVCRSGEDRAKTDWGEK